MQKLQMSNSWRANRGNTLALLIAFVGIVTVLLAYFLINYSQMFGTHKEAQTAIDAAALQAASDMTKVVVDTPLGRLALVDDSASSNVHPVVGINTVLGNLRLNSIIANKLNNKAIQYLVSNDIKILKDASTQLRQRLLKAANGDPVAFDKNGGIVDIVKNSKEAYENNSRRLGNSDQVPQNFKVEVGGLNLASGEGKTNIPVPNPENADSVAFNNANSFMDDAGRRCYRPNVDFVLPGIGSNIKFNAIGDHIGLVDNAAFAPESALPAGLVPVTVKVTADEKITRLAKSVGESKTNNKSQPAQLVKVAATATVGGRIYLPPTGTLVLSFPAGFPSEPGNGLSFNSGVQGIMNHAQLDASGNSTGNGAWQGSANWFVAKGGTIPGSGTPTKENFKGLSGHDKDNPSVVLAFQVYDWLKTLSLRPNVNAVVTSLKYNFKDFAISNNAEVTQQFTANASDWMPKAYAGSKDAEGVLTAVLITSLQKDPDGDIDLRSLEYYNTSPQEYQRQQARMWGYIPAEGVLPPRAMMVRFVNGATLTTDNNPLGDLYDFFTAVRDSNYHASHTIDAVRGVVEEKTSQLGKGDKFTDSTPAGTIGHTESQAKVSQEFLDQNPRIRDILFNAFYVSAVTAKMDQSMLTLTGGGVKKVSDGHYIVMGTDFFPIKRAASTDEILGAGPISTGQDSKAPSKDWAAPVTGSGKDIHSNLAVYKRVQNPVIGQTRDQLHLEQPAMAQSTQVSGKYILVFKAEGGTINGAKLGQLPAGNAKITLYKKNTAIFGDIPILEGQAHYQNTQALKVPDTNVPSQEVVWQVQARDLNANAYPANNSPTADPNPNSAATHYSNVSSFGKYDAQWCDPANGNQDCPTIAAEWSLTCPVPLQPPPPPVPPAPPKPKYVAPPPPPTPCWMLNGPFYKYPIWIGNFMWWNCDYYNGCGTLINRTHS